MEQENQANNLEEFAIEPIDADVITSMINLQATLTNLETDKSRIEFLKKSLLLPASLTKDQLPMIVECLIGMTSKDGPKIFILPTISQIQKKMAECELTNADFGDKKICIGQSSDEDESSNDSFDFDEIVPKEYILDTENMEYGSVINTENVRIFAKRNQIKRKTFSDDFVKEVDDDQKALVSKFIEGRGIDRDGHEIGAH